MKKHPTLKFVRGLTTALGGFALFAGSLQAVPFLYSTGDLILAFRQDGNSSDLVVNIGKTTNYSALPPGNTFTVTNLSAAQLGSAFPSLNDLHWSVTGAIKLSSDPNYPNQSLWATAPRLENAVQSPAWKRDGQFLQGYAATQIDSVGLAAANYSSSQSVSVNNSVTGVVIPTSSDYAFTPIIGSASDYGGFQGNVENVTASDFDGDVENSSRSDLYELLAGTSAAGTLNAPGRFLGYFELKPDGTLTFHTATSAPPVPVITTVVRTGTVTTVSFTTVTGVTYQLRSTTAAGLTSPISTWTTGGSIAGNGSTLSLQDTSSAETRFFAIQAQP